MQNVSILKKGGHFLTPKVSVFMEIGVFFSLKIREKESFFKSGNADMSSLSEESAGTGALPHATAMLMPRPTPSENIPFIH